MPDINFSRFIHFGSIADKERRTEIATFIYEQLQKNQNTISLPNDTVDNFGTTIEDILSNKIMRELCTNDPSLAEHITTDILDFINKTKKHLQRLEDPFENEQNLLDNFKQTKKDSFEKLWEVTAPFVQEIYEQHIIDTEFYYGEFQKSIEPSKRVKIKSVLKV